MDPHWIVIGITALFGLYMAWTIGANDFANSMGSAVGSKSLSVRRAIVLGCLCELAGSILVGMYVSDTLRKGIVVPTDFVQRVGGTPENAAALLTLGMACALLGSSVWLHLATWLGMPVSTTHAIVGAVTGFGIVAAGWAVVDWGMMSWIVASWFISPLGGFLLAYVCFRLIQWCILGRENPVPATVAFGPVLVFLTAAVVIGSVLFKGHVMEVLGIRCLWLEGDRCLVVILAAALGCAIVSRRFIARYLRGTEGLGLPDQLLRVERVFHPLVVITACSVAFAHGANDVANAVGPLAAVNDIVLRGTLQMGGAMPLWILLLGGAGIVIGLVTYGHKVMQTIGTDITVLTPSRGVAASLATTATVLVCSRMGWPVSTSHTIVGAVIGIGLARGLGAVNLQILRQIGVTWVLTVPAAAVVTIVLFLLGRAVGLDAFIARAITLNG